MNIEVKFDWAAWFKGTPRDEAFSILSIFENLIYMIYIAYWS